MKKKKENKMILSDSSYEFIKKVKLVVLKAVFKDDYLEEHLTLKGGTLLDMVWKVTKRPSIDADFSIDTSISNIADLEKFKTTLKKALVKEFELGIDGESYELFDFEFKEAPPSISDDFKSFWGGYTALFKIIKSVESSNLDLETKRMKAIMIGKSKNKKHGDDIGLTAKYSIDISLHEICQDDRIEKEVGDVFISIYTPLMVVYEKIRAICQTNEKYNVVIKRDRESTPRTRDFYDIYQIVKKLEIDVKSNVSLLKSMFNVKRVPLDYLKDVKEEKNYHGQNFDKIKATLEVGELEHDTFDPYFDFVVDLIENQIVPNL
jgi:hypothetical protein